MCQAAARILAFETQLATVKLDGVRMGIEAAAEISAKRHQEWRAAIAAGLQRITVSKQYAAGAEVENELAAFSIRNLDPAAIVAKAS